MILGAIAGTLAGVLTGLTPGIHVNTVTALLLAGSTVCAPLGIEYSSLLAFTGALAISHTFFDVVPGLFLGVPGDETFALLPGHRMVRRGEGQAAVQLSVAGSAIGLALGVTALAAQLWFGNFVGEAERLINPAMFWILLVVAVILILSERYRVRSLFAFLASGLLGVAVFGSPLVAGGSDAPVNALFPSLSGLFGVAGLLYSIATTTTSAEPAPSGKPMPLRARHVGWPGLRGGFAGLLVGLLPGLGGANAATLLLLLERRKSTRDEEDRSYLVTTSSLNTAEALFAIAALYLIGRSRSGASIAVEQILGGNIRESDIWLIAVVMIAAGGMASAILWRLGGLLSRWVQSFDSVSLNVSVIAFLTVLTVLFLRVGGLAILICATAVGLIPLLFNVRRAQSMGFFLLPTMLYFSGYQGEVVDVFSIGYKTAPLVASGSVVGMLLKVVGAAAGATLAYRLVSNSHRLTARYPALRPLTVQCGALATVLILLLTLAGRAYPPAPDASRMAAPATTVPGRIMRVVDGDTYVLASLCRRFRVRLKGVDAPELGTANGDRARDWATSRFTDRGVTLRPVGVDVYGRVLGYLVTDDGTNINSEIIRLGYADEMREQSLASTGSPRPGTEPADPKRVGAAEVETTSSDESIPWDDNRDGRVTCSEARQHGIAPVRRGDAAYRYMRDSDGDGVVCE